MPNIAIDVFGELAGIGRNVFRSFREDLFFPIHPLSDSDKFRKKIMGQHKIIRSMQDDLSHKTSVIVHMERKIAQLDQLLADKDKELKRLKALLKSMEFRLHEETSRNMRKR